MASGDTLLVFTPLSSEPPATVYATVHTRNGHPVLDFDAATDEKAFFSDVLPRNYAGGGITAYIIWMASTATSGNVIWQIAWERASTDLDSDSFATAIASAQTVPNGTSGITTTATIAFSNAQIDGLTAGEAFRLQLVRNSTNPSDNMSGDAELVAIELKET